MEKSQKSIMGLLTSFPKNFKPIEIPRSSSCQDFRENSEILAKNRRSTVSTVDFETLKGENSPAILKKSTPNAFYKKKEHKSTKNNLKKKKPTNLKVHH